VDGGFIYPNLLGAWSKLTKCLLRWSVNYTVDPLRAFDVGLLMAAMQRKRTVAAQGETSEFGHKPTYEPTKYCDPPGCL
jgi:hypothetical protein